MGKPKSYHSTIGQIRTTTQLIRHRNIMLGLPIKKLRVAAIPWGYEDDPDREGWLRPIERHLRLLYKARTLHNRSTLESLAEWLSKETGRPMTWQTLQYIFAYRPPLYAYQLTPEQRLLIATAETEELAYTLTTRPKRKDPKGTDRAYRESREEAVRRKEEARSLSS